MAFTTVTVTGHFESAGGAAATGTVEFVLSCPIGNAGIILEPVTITAALDATGKISVELQANDDTATSPAGSTYTVTERITTAPVREYSIVVPHTAPTGTVDLSTLMPGQPGFG